MSTYTPLQAHLAGRSEASITMSYEDIEKLIGKTLPPTAYGEKKRQWWANTETHSQALAWLRANRKAKLDVKRQEVTFIRQSDPAAQSAPERDDAVVLTSLSPTARRMLEDVAEERGVSLAVAGSEVLNEMAKRRRAATLDWFAGRSTFSDVSSATLLREDRDAR